MEEAKPLRSCPPILTPIAPRPHDLNPPFTESELAVAQQLIHLSESSGPSASANSMGSASSSTRSVNIQASTPPDDMVEDDGGLWRKIKRYRPIADVYASTIKIGDDGVGKERRKRRGRNDMEESGSR